MNEQSAKRRREDDDDDGSAIAIDRLSQLPQPILHNILSLLSQRDAVRTSVLSKSWRYLWHCRLNAEFLDTHHRFFRKNRFWSFLDKTLQRYLDQNLSLHQFIVDIHYDLEFVDFELLQKWIPMVIMNMGVRSFNLNLPWSTKASYPVPLAVFQSESLVELHLQGCDLRMLRSAENVMFKNLQTLRLRYVHITDEIFEKIILSCPLIENLDLYMCSVLKSIKLHKHHKIKGFFCSVNVPLIIEIEDSHPLESVRIQNYCIRDWFLPHKNMHFPHLKSLHMYKVQLPAETFDNFSSFFPCLSELILKSCDGLKEFRLLSSSIKRLTIIMDTRNRIKAFIDTPNVLYFKYSGNGFLPSIKFATTSNEWTSEISVWYELKSSDKDATPWFLKLSKLLKSLSQSHISLNLFSSKYKQLHINDSCGGFYKPVVVEYLYFSRRLSPPSDPPSDPAILNCFFQICRPRYIHIDVSGNELVEFICNLIPKEKGSYFWLQDLEEVSIEIWEIIEDGWHWVQTTSLPESPNRPPIRFRLTWREQLSMFT